MNSTRAIRVSLFLLTFLCFLVVTQKATLQGTNCCTIPTNETSEARGTNDGLTIFRQTISDSANTTFDGRHVREMAGDPPVDNCHFDGSEVDSYHLTGGTWVVGSSAGVQRNTWGYDSVGFRESAIYYYQTERPARGLSLPCTATAFQNMEIECGTDWAVYAPNNILGIQIDVDNYINCRIGVCAQVDFGPWP